MATSTNIPEFSNSDIWSMFKETDRLLQETNRVLSEKNSETSQLIKELRESQSETDKLIKETNRILTEKQLETDRILSEKNSETSQLIKELRESQKELNDRLGGMANSHGSFAEEYFFNSFQRGQVNFFGEKFDEIEKQVKPKSKKLQDEYDIVLYNCTTVAILEAKYKAHVNDLPKIVKKVDTFRELCPDYKNYKIYLGLASMAFYPELEQECINLGIAIIKQVGETIIIQDEHLKTF